MTNIDTRKNNNRSRYIIRAILVLAMLSTTYLFLNAYSDGITGQTNNGCTCHGSSNSSTTISISAENETFTVNTGSSNYFTVTVSNSGRSYFGVNIGVKTTQTGETNAGSLANLNTDLRTSNNELTHTQPKNSSGSATFSFSWTAPTTPGTYYIRAAGNAVDNNGQSSNDQWNKMTVQTITVVAPTSITLTSPVGSENLCAGSSKAITWNSSNINNVKIELSSDGGSSYPTTLVANTQASTGSWTWNIPAGQSVGNNYRIRISDASNASINSTSQSNFSIAPVTSISTHPQSVSVCAGQQVQLSVTATGAALSYRWRKYGTDVPNATTSTLTLNNIQPANAGSYTCVVTGACGSPATSNAANVSVDAVPTITAQPEDKAICENNPVTFSITATGADISYSWRKNGTVIPNTNNPTFTINNVRQDDAGDYDCVITGKCNPAATSVKAKLVVNKAPAIQTQPAPVTVCEGKNTVVFVRASGDDLEFVWRKNGIEIPNTNNDTLFFENISKSDAGNYSVKISGKCTPEIISNSTSVTVNPLAVITKQPVSQTLAAGSKLELEVIATGDNLKYQWKKDGSNLSGKTESTLTINNVKPEDSGTYLCEVTNNCGSVLTEEAAVTVNPVGDGPALSLNPGNVNFSVVALGKSKEITLPSVIINSGSEKLIISSLDIEGTNSSEFEILNLQLPIELESTQTYDLIIKFTPSGTQKADAGLRNAAIVFQSNAESSPKLNLSATAAFIDIQTDITELIITTESIGNSEDGKIEITNNSSIKLTMIPMIAGANASDFTLLGEATQIVIEPNEKKEIEVSYKASNWMTAEAELTLSIVETEDTIVIPLKGNVVTSILTDLTNSVRIYPNPMDRQITIDLSSIDEPISSILIFDAKGNLATSIKPENISQNNKTAVWSGLNNQNGQIASGSYRIVIETSKRTLSYPFVINN